MKKFTIVLVFLFTQLSLAQIGIGNTNPQSTLDISTSNVTTPSNTDGILIPRIDNFPATNPTASQDGMMVFYTGTAASGKGFYYWNQTTTSWVSMIGASDGDWYEFGTTTPPNSNSDNIYNSGQVQIGIGPVTSSDSKLSVIDTDDTLNAGIFVNRFHTNNTAFGHNGISQFTRLDGSGGYSGMNSTLQSISTSTGTINNYNAVNNISRGNSSSSNTLYRGAFNSNTGTSSSANSYGAFIEYSANATSAGNKYGYYIDINSSLPATHYGIYSSVQKPSGYAGYFLGRTSLGTSTTNRYLMPEVDGTTGQVMTTDGIGNVTFQNVSGDGTGTDDQNLTLPTLSGTTLNLGIENGTGTSIDLAALQDGTGTDNQTIDNFSFDSISNILTLEIENDGVAPQTIDLSSLNTMDADWYLENTTTPPSNITDDIYTNGNVGIGVSNIGDKLEVLSETNSRIASFTNESNQGAVRGILIDIDESSASTSGGNTSGIHNSITRSNQSFISGVSNSFPNSTTNSTGVILGYENSFGSSTSNISIGLINRFQGITGEASGVKNLVRGTFTDLKGVSNYNNSTDDLPGNFYGLHNTFSGSSAGERYGVYTSFAETGNGLKYGEYIDIPSTAGGIHYGIYADVQKTTGYAGYFLGRTSLGIGTTNRYLMPAVGGSANQIMATDGAGQVSFVDASSIISNVDSINDLFDGKSDNDGSENYSSLFLGFNAGLNDNSSDNKNVGIGFNAINVNTSGEENTAVGHRAFETNFGANQNTALGYYALRGVNASGSNANTAIGHNAMGGFFSNTVAESNVAVGASALEVNASGDFNVSIGRNSLSNSSTASRNVAIGHNALQIVNSLLGSKTAIGYNAMANYTSNEVAVAIGAESMENADGCEDCTAVGNRTLRANTSGIQNLAIGLRSLESNTTGDRNVALGTFALNTNTTGSKNIAIGNFAGAYNTQSNKLFIDSYDDFADALANGGSPLIYGEFDNDIFRTNGEFQIGNPAGSGYAFPIIDGAASQVLTTNGTGAVAWQTPTNGDITSVTAGDGLIGGGAVGAVTLDIVATNGLTDTANDVRLGGTLTQATTITQANNDMIFNLNSTGDFRINDNGITKLLVLDNGDTVLGGDLYMRDEDTGGTVLGRFTDINGDDGAFDLYNSGALSTRINGGGDSYLTGGNLGIGTTTPDYNLSVTGALNLREDIAGGGAALRVNGTEALWFDGALFSWGFGGTANFFSDDVGIGINAPAYKLDVRNNIATNYVAQIYNTNTGNDADGLRIQLASATPGATNTFIGFLNSTGAFRGRINGSATGVNYLTTSDERLKTNISNIDNALNLIDKIQPRRYEYKANLGTQEYGFIAQELQPLYPQAVSGTPDSDVEINPMMVDYSRLTPLLTAGLKELKKEVDTLKTENAILKAKLNQLESLEARLSALENKTKKDK